MGALRIRITPFTTPISSCGSGVKRLEILPKNEPQELFVEYGNLDVVKKLVIQTWDKDRSARVQVLDFVVKQVSSTITAKVTVTGLSKDRMYTLGVFYGRIIIE